MVEVFKTNVSHCDDANSLLNQIHQNFKNYKANFDLDDCDLILRIESVAGLVSIASIISLLKQNGFTAIVLLDDLD